MSRLCENWAVHSELITARAGQAEEGSLNDDQLHIESDLCFTVAMLQVTLTMFVCSTAGRQHLLEMHTSPAIHGQMWLHLLDIYVIT